MAFYVRGDDVERIAQPADVTDGTLTPSFLERLLSPQIERSVIISPYRKAAYSHIRDGFAKALESRWSHSGLTEDERTEATSQLNRFRQLFPKGSFNVGDQLLISSKGTMLRLFHNVIRVYVRAAEEKGKAKREGGVVLGVYSKASLPLLLPLSLYILYCISCSCIYMCAYPYTGAVAWRAGLRTSLSDSLCCLCGQRSR